MPAHRAAVEAAMSERDAQATAVVLTHHHADHAEATGWAADWGATVYAFTPALIPTEAVPLAGGETLDRAAVRLEAVHTPGHTSDHLCLRIHATGAVLSGDHVLGRGTSVVAWPDGNMTAYLASLRRLDGLAARVLYPGHGPVVHQPAAVIASYLAHRAEREAQVLAALAAGYRTPRQIVAHVYADVDPVLHPFAERTVRAHLEKLREDRRITRTDPPRVLR